MRNVVKLITHPTSPVLVYDLTESIILSQAVNQTTKVVNKLNAMQCNAMK